MKKYTSKGLADMAGTMGSILLFLLFAVCMLIMISVAASAYSKIKGEFGQTFSASSSLKYVTNKLRSADSAEILGEGSGLAVKSGGLVCVIYSAPDGIYEKSIPADETPEMSGGSLIFEDMSLSVTEDGELYTVSVCVGGDSGTVLVRKG